MEEVVLVVTRENCETLIGKNVRVIVSDSKEEEGDTAAKNASEKTRIGASAEGKTSDVFFCTLFPWAFTREILVVVLVLVQVMMSSDSDNSLI